MSCNIEREPLLEMFIFETNQLLMQLEESVLESEKKHNYQLTIDEVFRVMHSIKSSSAMMLFNNISTLAHSVEDLYYFLRKEKPAEIDYGAITDLVLESADFIKRQIALIEKGEKSDEQPIDLTQKIKETLAKLKKEEIKTSPKVAFNFYQVNLCFEDGCQMENVRAFAVVHKLQEIASKIEYYPQNIEEDDETTEIIKKEGFHLSFSSHKTREEIEKFFSQIAFLKKLQIKQLNKYEDNKHINKSESKKEFSCCQKKNFISVHVQKVDQLLNLVGELVVAEAMVTKNPELAGLHLDSFYKAARQLGKISHELQDIAMSMRMLPLTDTFQKMKRLVRDMSRKIGKEVELEIYGQETEVDKNIIEHISDPLIHLIRNALDHGLENSMERKEKNKPVQGKIILSAKSIGGDVWITVQDDGKGIDKEKVVARALENGLIAPGEEKEMSEQQIHSLIFLPGFSTKEQVTEFSGRGVGMDVVLKNIEKLGGNILIESILGQGTIFSIKIPLTLAIIDGMTIKVGKASYTVPLTAIKQSFRALSEQIIIAPDGSESILVRGNCYPILRLHNFYKNITNIQSIEEGILMMVENDGQIICLFADCLLGQQQVVVKPLPKFIKKVDGLAGCTLLADGSISLILDISALIN